MTADIISRVKVLVWPKLQSKEMTERWNKEGKRRALNSKTARSMLSLCHSKGREYTKHACRIHGKEFVGHAKEDYTTKVCPVCVICRESFGGEWFKCTNGECRYEAPRDLKSAPCILLKYLKGLRERIEWRRVLLGGAVDVLDVEDTMDSMVVDE